MTKRTIAAAFLILTLGCASGQDDAQPVQIEVTPVGLTQEILRFPGPLNVQFVISVTNGLATPIHFKNVQLSTAGSRAAWTLRSSNLTIDQDVAPGATREFSVSAWGSATGGDFASQEPVSLHALATFAGPDGKPFIRSLTHLVAVPSQ